MKRMKLPAVFLLSLALAGCAGQPKDAGPRTYDLGAQAPAAKLPGLRAVTVRAAMPYDGVEMHYRLAFRDAAEISSYAGARWAAPPSELVRRHILRALPASASAPCALELELQDFSQVFPAKDSSEARIELRATLATAGARVASRGVSISEPNAGAGAAPGAAAFARAAERAVSELGTWIASQSACKA